MINYVGYFHDTVSQWRNGSASDSRSEGWEFESLWPHFLASHRRVVLVHPHTESPSLPLAHSLALNLVRRGLAVPVLRGVVRCDSGLYLAAASAPADRSNGQRGNCPQTTITHDRLSWLRFGHTCQPHRDGRGTLLEHSSNTS